MKEKFESAIGHKTSLYKYGDDDIKSGIVALIAGGGNDIEMLKEIVKEKVNVLITGVTIKNDYSKKAHEFAKQNNINLLGGTHYSTEKFACIAMCEYFKKLGLPSEFIKDKPMMEDL
ncbi:MAG: Nif3-like dinuclear metal center hexameric protein [Acidobacteriota bacterium]